MLGLQEESGGGRLEEGKSYPQKNPKVSCTGRNCRFGALRVHFTLPMRRFDENLESVSDLRPHGGRTKLMLLFRPACIVFRHLPRATSARLRRGGSHTTDDCFKRRLGCKTTAAEPCVGYKLVAHGHLSHWHSKARIVFGGRAVRGRWSGIQ